MGNRYSLVSIYNGNSSIIKIKEYDQKLRKVVNKEKVSLATIDLLTSHFDSKEDFNRYFNLPSKAKLSIVYQSNKHQKEIPCVYSNNQIIRYFANEVGTNENEIAEYDKYFKKIISKILLGVCKPSLKRHIMVDPTINIYIKEKMTNYLYGSYDEKFIVNKLESELRKYKNLRSVIINIKNYEFDTGNKIFNLELPEIEECLPEQNVSLTEFIPSDTLLEPLFPLNSEEEQNYYDYIGNLPDSFCCHEEYICLTKKRNNKKY